MVVKSRISLCLKKRTLRLLVFKIYSDYPDFSSTIVPTKKHLRDSPSSVKERKESKLTATHKKPNTEEGNRSFE